MLQSPLPIAYENIRKNLSSLPQDCIPVITGFIGVTQDGSVTTLGRGGSDFSAAIIGAAIGASVIEIWTDVDGIMSADPRVVPSAKTIAQVSFQEAAELAFSARECSTRKQFCLLLKKHSGESA